MNIGMEVNVSAFRGLLELMELMELMEFAMLLVIKMPIY
jgi:hypothetical protein